MKYRILGNLRVADGNSIILINAVKMKTLLAALLLRSNRVVPFEQIVTELWGDNPPRRASAAVHVYVSQLRKLLKGSGQRKSPILTQPPGYLIRIEEGELDLDVFLRLTEECRRHQRDGHHQEVVDLATKALDMWQEPILSDLHESDVVNRFSVWLEELRVELIEMVVDAHLALGRHRESVSYIYSLLQDYPLHETFHRQLMLALYNSGRTGDALLAYRSARDSLQQELGLEPNRSLQDLQQLILKSNGSRSGISLDRDPRSSHIRWPRTA
ncbi:AfsR/SARP family transcriptional regulator [Micromonospora zamorensis]|uniref:AfsR/SARP family transcriptional regulator n=1 Tax=Micromonospora zamorensis TaxID=709883 RepID=UPI003D90474A